MPKLIRIGGAGELAQDFFYWRKAQANKKTPIMNKALFFMVALSAIAGPSIAQEGRHHAPASVQRSFQRDYPEAGNPEWSETNGQWSADFTDHSRYDRGEMVAHYDRSGHHVDSHVPYDRSDVPTAVVARTQRNYPDASGDSYTRIERPGQRALFQVSLRAHGRRHTIYVDDNGRERKYYDHH
jgi:hypothetical protein